MRVPYFSTNDLLVAASLNGGNVLSAFVGMVHSWQNALVPTASMNLTIDAVWTRLIELALGSPPIICDHFSAALFGERHDPSMSAGIDQLRSIHMTQFHQIGSLFRSICRWIVQNLFDMLGDSTSSMTSVIGTGSALSRNIVLQTELRDRLSKEIFFNEKCDAAYGAALFALMQ
jgi:sedoheptulokinase